MKNKLNQLLDKIFCMHKWNLYFHIIKYEDETKNLPYKRTDTLICKKCGKIKKITL